MRRLLLLVLGWGLVILGLVGLVLPILQGLLFLALGLYVLSLEQPWVHRQRQRLQARFPRFAAALHAAEDRGRALYRRVTGREPDGRA